MSVVFDVTMNGVCSGGSSVYQGICETTSNLAKFGSVKNSDKTFIPITAASSEELNREGNPRS